LKNKKQLIGAYLGIVLLLSSCNDYFRNDYDDNSPTSGQLKFYYDEGLELHAKNQAETFQAIYPNAHLELYQSTDASAIQSLYNDSCEAIMISRLLSNEEKRAFESKGFFPKYSAVAKSGIAVITNSGTPLNGMSVEEIKKLVSENNEIRDSSGNMVPVKILLDRSNSSVSRYLMDSLAGKKKFPAHCNAMKSTPEAISYIAANKNTIAIIDFAWLSDADDPLVKSVSQSIKILPVSVNGGNYYFPDQSNFKLGNYPLTRQVYIMRKTGEFSIAKGFESFVMGPKGQLTFLKQGLLPNRQGERAVKISQPTAQE
jgi:phosphate transport system substrate-binding protein